MVLNLLAMLVGLGIGLLAAPAVLRRLPGVVDTASDYLDEVEADGDLLCVNLFVESINLNLFMVTAFLVAK